MCINQQDLINIFGETNQILNDRSHDSRFDNIVIVLIVLILLPMNVFADVNFMTT